jgi:hypothetical protein
MIDGSASAPRSRFFCYACFLMPHSSPGRRNMPDAATRPLTKALAPASPPDNGATG